MDLVDKRQHSSAAASGQLKGWLHVLFLPQNFVYAFAFVICILISVASYPGFMSFDSLESLRQARGQVEGGPYPPFGAYVWRALDAIWPGPTLMQLVQNGVLLFSFAYVVRKIQLPTLVQLLAIALFALLPPILGIMVVVWKDVAVAACLLAAFALLFYAKSQPTHRNFAIGAALVFLFSGMAYRYNAASAVAPLAVYVALCVIQQGNDRSRLVKAFLVGAPLTLVMFGMVSFVNGHRFPTLEKLDSNENMANIQNYDLIGISVHSGVSLVPDGNGGYVPVAYLDEIYDPVHLNRMRSKDLLHLIHTAPDVSDRWIDAIRRYPGAYLQHRSDLFEEFLDFHDRAVFYPTHPFVDPNKYGITYTPTQFSTAVVDYVVRASKTWISRPWVYFDVALLLLVLMYAFRAKTFRLEAVVVYSSGVLYLLPMYFISPAADLRYNFWSICASIIASILALTSITRAIRGRFSAA